MKAKVYWVPGPWRGRLGIVPRPRGQDWLADEVRSWRDAGIAVVVSLLTPDEIIDLELQDEADRCRQEGLEFHAFPIPDLGIPPTREGVNVLVHTLEKALDSGKNVAVHCRQGIGRSAMVVASVLVDSGEAPDDAFHSIEAVRGVPVPETLAQREWVEEMAAANPHPPLRHRKAG